MRCCQTIHSIYAVARIVNNVFNHPSVPNKLVSLRCCPINTDPRTGNSQPSHLNSYDSFIISPFMQALSDLLGAKFITFEWEIVPFDDELNRCVLSIGKLKDALGDWQTHFLLSSAVFHSLLWPLLFLLLQMLVGIGVVVWECYCRRNRHGIHHVMRQQARSDKAIDGHSLIGGGPEDCIEHMRIIQNGAAGDVGGANCMELQHNRGSTMTRPSPASPEEAGKWTLITAKPYPKVVLEGERDVHGHENKLVDEDDPYIWDEASGSKNGVWKPQVRAVSGLLNLFLLNKSLFERSRMLDCEFGSRLITETLLCWFRFSKNNARNVALAFTITGILCLINPKSLPTHFWL